MIKIGISGVCGRMGKRILHLASHNSEFNIVFGLENKDHPDVGRNLEKVIVTCDPEEIKNCDCLIEFSTSQATLDHLPHLVKYGKCAVIGTTGFTEEMLLSIKKAAKKIPIVFSPNMSVGVNLLFRLVREAAKILKDYKLYLEEAHHIHKKDAPSGTAKRIAQILIEEGFCVKIEDIVSVREDEIIGDHSVVFKSDVDDIELSHSAKTRDIFAKGAIIAAKWIIDKKSGFYSMDDVLFRDKV